MLETPRVVENGNIGPVNSAKVPRYSGEPTFALLPRLRDLETEGRTADIKIIGAPFDTGVSYRPGARLGPSHVRQSSRLLRPYNPGTSTSPFAQVQVADAGDMALNPFNIKEAISSIEEDALALTEDAATLLTIGRDHTIALPLLRAASKRAGEPVALLHFDAHLDTSDTYFGADYTHGTPFRRAAEEGVINSSALCHVGTRGPLYGKKDLDDDEAFGFGIVSSADIFHKGVGEVVSMLRNRIGDRPLYISLDIDVLDP